MNQAESQSPQDFDACTEGPHHRLVLLWWDDSYGGGGWVDKDEQESRVAKCVTAGFVVGETDEHITVTCSMTEGADGQYLGPITIPKSCITKQQILKQNSRINEKTFPDNTDNQEISAES